jgi:hypothetical protein
MCVSMISRFMGLHSLEEEIMNEEKDSLHSK